MLVTQELRSTPAMIIRVDRDPCANNGQYGRPCEKLTCLGDRQDVAASHGRRRGS